MQAWGGGKLTLEERGGWIRTRLSRDYPITLTPQASITIFSVLLISEWAFQMNLIPIQYGPKSLHGPIEIQWGVVQLV